MAEIRPFRGVYYNQLLVSDLSAVICPPYDIITPQLQQELYHRSQYNFVRLEHSQELPQDTAINNKYTRSAATLEQWLKQGVLKVDEVPTIYLHDHYFTYQGKEYRRRGIIVCVRLEEWNKMVVRPHEGTLAEPRDDRLSLLWACQANTSPILALFEDQGQKVASLVAAQERNKPIISSSSAGGESHNVWAITEPEVIDQICCSLAHQPLYIADGHHRYESALIYQRERRALSSSVSGDEAFNFVLTELVDFSDPGLIILPPHRLVRGISKSTLNGLIPKLKLFFEIEELPLGMPDTWQKVDEPLPDKANQVKLVLFGLATERLFVLKLRDYTTISQMMPYFHSELYKRSDVSIVDNIILEKLLGLGSGQEEAILAYSYDRLDAVNRVLDQEYQLAFLLSPVKPEVVKAIADAGDRMSRKSTYFYPKLPAGLILHRLV
ncbi:MAG: DUF1015 domain-containing protein [Dehalococcoidales bacterium]|nr:DUF1015 domain-containing protein [Dehalococcoidales bacterium]